MQSFLLVSTDQDLRAESANKLAAHFSLPIDTHIYNTNESNSIDLVREIQNKLLLTPLQSRFNTVVIHDAHNLTLPAQNALLKTLEEPPGKSVLILTTNNPELLLPTVVSRCLIKQYHTQTNLPTTKVKLFDSLNQKASLSQILAEENFNLEEYAVALREALRNAMLVPNSPPETNLTTLLTRLRNTFYSLKLTRFNVNKKLLRENLFLD